MKIEEELARAVRSEAARGRPGKGRGGPWASGRPRRGAPRLPRVLPVSGRSDRGRRRRAQLFPPRRGAQGEGREESISPVAWEPSSGRPRAGARSGAPTAERTPNFALSSPQPPLCHNFAAATVRGHRPTPPLRSPTGDPRRSGVREGHREPGPRPRTPPPRRRSPRLGGPHARPAAAAPLTCIDAMMKPSPQGQRGQRRRGRSRRARVTPRGPNIPGTGWSRRWEGAGTSDWLWRGRPGA